MKNGIVQVYCQKMIQVPSAKPFKGQPSCADLAFEDTLTASNNENTVTCSRKTVRKVWSGKGEGVPNREIG